MNNYTYIIASLPQLSDSFDADNFNYGNVRQEIAEQLSEADLQLVETLEEGFKEESLNADYYAKTGKSKNSFIRDYFDFDARLRNMKAQYLAKRLEKQADDYLIEMPEADFDEEQAIRNILENTDFVSRELQMDKLKWDKANELATFDYFNINAILAFLVKAKLVQRWAELDAAKGEELFRKLVKEIRGTSAELDLSGGGIL